MSHRQNPSRHSVDRQVTSLLNKLAASNFDSISDQIVGITTNEPDRTKIAFLIVDTAVAQPGRSELYARLLSSPAFKTLSTKVCDD